MYPENSEASQYYSALRSKCLFDTDYLNENCYSFNYGVCRGWITLRLHRKEQKN